MMVSGTPVLSPLPILEAHEEQPVRHFENLGGKTVGFLSAFWPPYKPLVEELTGLLQQKFEVAATPRADYIGRPPLKGVWAEQQQWVEQLDAGVVGIGA
jgi:hypothetical protein